MNQLKLTWKSSWENMGEMLEQIPTRCSKLSGNTSKQNTQKRNLTPGDCMKNRAKMAIIKSSHVLGVRKTLRKLTIGICTSSQGTLSTVLTTFNRQRPKKFRWWFRRPWTALTTLAFRLDMTGPSNVPCVTTLPIQWRPWVNISDPILQKVLTGTGSKSNLII